MNVPGHSKVGHFTNFLLPDQNVTRSKVAMNNLSIQKQKSLFKNTVKCPTSNNSSFSSLISSTWWRPRFPPSTPPPPPPFLRPHAALKSFLQINKKPLKWLCYVMRITNKRLPRIALDYVPQERSRKVRCVKLNVLRILKTIALISTLH